MFGLRAQVIAGLLVVALLVIAGGIYVVRYLIDENAALTVKTARLEQTIRDHEAAERALRADLASKEQAHAEALRAREHLAAALRQQRADRAHLVESVAEVRAWAEQRLPDHVLAGLRGPGVAVGAESDRAAAPDGAARADTDAAVPGRNER